VHGVVGDLLPGDKVMAFDTSKNKVFWDTVYYVRKHGGEEIEHFKVSTGENGESFTATAEHLLFISKPTGPIMARVDSLKKGDLLLKVEGEQNSNTITLVKVMGIEKTKDIPLSPITKHGKIMVGSLNIAFSCWSNSEEYARWMDLMAGTIARIVTKITPVSWWSRIAETLYEKIFTHVAH